MDCSTCGTCDDVDFSRLSRNLSKVQARANIADVNQDIYLKVIYYVVYNQQSDNIPLLSIQAQHSRLNQDFNATNADLSKVPSSGKYDFADVIGNCKTTFIPQISSELTEGNVVRLHTTKLDFKSIDSIESYVKSRITNLSVPINGIMNIYICRLQGNVLGQAYLHTNSCVIDTGTVGNNIINGNGAMASYRTGRTATHEVGHVFGMPHTFNQNKSCTQEFADIPGQKNPNYSAQLIDLGGGVYDGLLCNRYRDCSSPAYDLTDSNPPYGCLGVGVCNEPFEQFMNYMDYGNDINSIMFSKQQVVFMRTYILNTKNLTKFLPTESHLLDVVPHVNSDGIQSSTKINLFLLILLIAALVVVVILGVLLRLRKTK